MKNVFVMYSQVPNNKGDLNKMSKGVGGSGWATDNLNINKRGGSNKRRDLKNVLGQKWQTVITNYGCPKQNFFALSRYS